MSEAAEERQPRLARDLLVAVDSSEPSGAGLTLAADIAERTGAHVTVVHVRQRPNPSTLSMGLGAEEMEHALDEVRDQVYERAKAALNERGVNWRFVTREGTNPGAEVVAAARELGADFIVLGSRTHSALHNLVIGSTSEYLVAHSPVPVLVAR